MKMKMEGIKGYKVFGPDWSCKGYKYEVGKIFEEDVTPLCCKRGFHFCKELKDCFKYYQFNHEIKVAEIIALGDIDEESDDSKCCTNKIYIVQEIGWEDVLRIVNLGEENSGLCNSGDHNSGDHNSGDHNSGDHNCGNCNSGNCNSGDHNSGNCNSGNHNCGDRNSGGCNSGNFNNGYWNCGDRNCGDRNSGERNSGDRNSGNCNSGNCNSGNHNCGDRNSGDRNSGYYNSGDRNSGDRNSGDYNSGNHNSGNHNSGDWNKTNFSSGCFNTEEPKIVLFNKPSCWTYRDWLYSNARHILNRIPFDVLEWIWSGNMTDEEKSSHPEHETTGGYLKMYEASESNQMWWDGLADYDQKEIKSLPNFDAEIFEQLTGIKVGE